MTPFFSSHAGRHDRPDPSKAPDPEEPGEDFDESNVSVLAQDQFEPPEDDSTITLDRCEPSSFSF